MIYSGKNKKQEVRSQELQINYSNARSGFTDGGTIKYEQTGF